MSPTEAYLFLFTDSIMASLVLVSNTEMVYTAMKIFGGYNKYYMMIVAISGSLVGGSINYCFGRILHYLKQNVGNYKDSTKFKNLIDFANRRLFWLVFFSFLPLLGVLLTTCSGLFKIKFPRFILMVLTGRLVYYLIQMIL